MVTNELNFTPDVFGNWGSWDLSEDWQMLRQKVNDARRISRDEAQEKSAEIASDFITDELVVNTLRSTERPEAIYWLLRYYMESNAKFPLIKTNRGKSIYIEFDRLEEMITLYIGSSDDVVCVGSEDGRKIYAMDVQEKYDFLWYASLGVVLKRHMSAGFIIEQAQSESGTAGPHVPTLFFTTGTDEESSVCALRTNNWFEVNEGSNDKNASTDEQKNNVVSVFSFRNINKSEKQSIFNRSAG